MRSWHLLYPRDRGLLPLASYVLEVPLSVDRLLSKHRLGPFVISSNTTASHLTMQTGSSSGHPDVARIDITKLITLELVSWPEGAGSKAR